MKNPAVCFFEQTWRGIHIQLSEGCMVPPPLSHAIVEGEESGPTSLSDHILRCDSFCRNGFGLRVSHRRILQSDQLVAEHAHKGGRDDGRDDNHQNDG